MNRHVTHVAFASHPHYSQAEVSPPAFNGFEISKYYKHRQYNKISMFSGTIHQREDSGKHYAFVQTQRISLKSIFASAESRQRMTASIWRTPMSEQVLACAALTSIWGAQDWCRASSPHANRHQMRRLQSWGGTTDTSCVLSNTLGHPILSTVGELKNDLNFYHVWQATWSSIS